jgi:hypothetical protein
LVLLVRILRALAVVTVAPVALHLAWGALAGGHRSMTLDWRGARVARGAHIAMPYPAGWHATVYGGRDIVLASFPVSNQWLASERKSVPAGGVYIWAFSYGRLPRTADGFPPRPQRLELDRQTFGYYECGFNLEGYNLVFQGEGRTVQVMVALGPGADEQAALAVINRLRIA